MQYNTQHNEDRYVLICQSERQNYQTVCSRRNKQNEYMVRYTIHVCNGIVSLLMIKSRP